MRILVLSNLYPPYYLGGYELACKDVVDGLKERGHDIWVLTSRYGICGTYNKVYRLLHFHWYSEPLISIWRFAWNQFRNSQCIKHIIRIINPDIVYVWGMGRLELSLPKEVLTYSEGGRKSNEVSYPIIPTVFAISDRWMLGEDGEYQHWMKYWEHIPPNPLKRKVKPLLKSLVSRYVMDYPLKPSIQYAHFFSQALQQQYADVGIVPGNSRIIYHGVSVEQYTAAHRKTQSPPKYAPVQLLYSGRLDQLKGVHTAIEAVIFLVYTKKISNIRLTIVGPQPYPEYVAELQELIKKHRLQHVINIHKKVSRDQLESIYNTHEILLFPSIWEEPFSIAILEAMAHGLAVIATPTGGSAEILRHAENSMVFPAGNAREMAKQIEILLQNPELATRIRTNAMKTIQTHYSLEKLVDHAEAYLKEIVNHMPGK